MIKLKKVIPIFMFIFSIFLIGNNKVKANEKSKIDTKFTPDYVYTSETDGMLDFADNKIGDKYHIPVKNDDFNEEMIIHYESDGIYWKTATDDKLIYSESNFLKVQWSLVYAPEFDQFIIYMHNMYDWVKNKNFHMFTILDNNYDTFPLYTDFLYFRAPHSDYYRYKIMYSKNSKINVQKSYNQDGFMGYKWYLYFSNRPVYITAGTTDKQYLNFMSSVNKPQLNYKNSFISNEDYDKLGKVSIEFSENDENISKYNYAQFKLQYGSNDFKQENIPIFSHYKVFGKANSNTNWEEVDPKSISYNDEKMNLQVIDTSYDYVEGSLADSTVTVQMDFMKSLNSLYEIWKIEFYFDNTQNGYFYVADTLINSKWTDTSKFLENYIYYEFPNDKMYAFISSENEKNSGKIYFPTNSIANEEVKINFKYFNLKNKLYDNPLSTIIYEKDDYYSYINFNFNNKESILAVNRRKGSHVVKTYGTDILNFYKSWFGLNKKIIPNEITYFYVPIGFNVYFSNGKDITQVKTSEGYVDINNSENTDYFNSSNDIDSISDLFKYISFEKNNKLISLINEMYNKFRNSSIGGYIYLILITSIIILVIKAMKR